MLDAILSPEWGDRYYSFNSRWAEGEEMASMRDGSGNDWFIVFSADGVYGRGFDHESSAAPGVFDSVPAVFGRFVAEPAFADHDGSPLATVCFWREPGDAGWSVSDAGSDVHDLFDVLVAGRPEDYVEWAAEYYGTEVSVEAVRHVYALRPLTPTLVAELNPELGLLSVEEDVVEIGYPR